MAKIYIDLETLAHLFWYQNKLEEEHRDRHYKDDPRQRGLIRTEVKSSLFHLFSKVVGVAEMAHDIPAHEKKRLIEKANMSSDSIFAGQHFILKGS